MPEYLSNIGEFPINIFDLFFGKKSIVEFYTPDFQREVAKDFWTDVMENELKIVEK